MVKKTIACLTLICFIGLMQGCYSTKWLSTQDFLNKPKTKGAITQIRMQDDTVIECKNKSSKGALVENNTIVYLMEDGSVKKIPISEVKALFFKKFSAWKVVGLIISVYGALEGAFAIVDIFTVG
jgi:hypothetical protein